MTSMRYSATFPMRKERKKKKRKEGERRGRKEKRKKEENRKVKRKEKGREREKEEELWRGENTVLIIEPPLVANIAMSCQILCPRS